MILRLRSRDGLERIDVPDDATVARLKQTVHKQLGIPLEDVWLSKDQTLLTATTIDRYQDLANSKATLKNLGLQHGDMLYLLYHFERTVVPTVKPETKVFGAHTSVDDVMAKQIRVEFQEKGHCKSVSLDENAANMFQSYVQALGFRRKRGGIMYGNVDDEGNVKVEFIYEPDQECEEEDLRLQRNTAEEEQVEFLAGLLGAKKVGWIFAQGTNQRDFIMSTAEIAQMAAFQIELGQLCPTVLVFKSEDGEVHFEAFQVSDVGVRLVQEGWIVDDKATTGVTKVKNPKEPDLKEPIIVASKDVDEVDNDYFLVAVGILQHNGPFLAYFPIENRMVPQGKNDLKEHLRKFNSKSYVERLSDFHLLLWLSKQPNLDHTDMVLLCEAVKEQKPVSEGYRLIIDSIAGL